MKTTAGGHDQICHVTNPAKLHIRCTCLKRSRKHRLCPLKTYNLLPLFKLLLFLLVFTLTHTQHITSGPQYLYPVLSCVAWTQEATHLLPFSLSLLLLVDDQVWPTLSNTLPAALNTLPCTELCSLDTRGATNHTPLLSWSTLCEGKKAILTLHYRPFL